MVSFFLMNVWLSDLRLDFNKRLLVHFLWVVYFVFVLFCFLIGALLFYVCIPYIMISFSI